MNYQPNLSGMFPPATPDSALETERNQSDQLESERICKSWSGSTIDMDPRLSPSGSRQTF